MLYLLALCLLEEGWGMQMENESKCTQNGRKTLQSHRGHCKKGPWHVADTSFDKKTGELRPERETRSLTVKHFLQVVDP